MTHKNTVKTQRAKENSAILEETQSQCTVGRRSLLRWTPINIDQATNKGYVDSAITADYQKKANIDMNNNRIINLPLPTGNNQPTTKAFTDNSYLHLDGSVAMNNNLNMNNKKIIHLLQPTDDTDAANKKYVDDNKVDVSNYLKVDGTNKMTGNLNINNRKIVNLCLSWMV